MESASADDVRARGSPKGLVLAPLQAQAQHYPKGEGWKRSQFGSRKRSQTDRQTDAPTTTTLIASGPPLRGDPYFVCISTTLLRNNYVVDRVVVDDVLQCSSYSYPVPRPGGTLRPQPLAPPVRSAPSTGTRRPRDGKIPSVQLMLTLMCKKSTSKFAWPVYFPCVSFEHAGKVALIIPK